ncbi:MAG: response regulator [Bacteroidetes bacterium]|nr:response regulator [Bacteroidota bacterium]
MKSVPINILLAEDDPDDRFFFTKALNEIPIATQLTIVRDGEELMEYLFANLNNLPTILFLDLSMPRKTGFECLTEIKEDPKLKDLTVVMISTSFQRDLQYEKNMIKMLYDIGAEDYIRKPNDFILLKNIIHNTITNTIEKKCEG